MDHENQELSPTVSQSGEPQEVVLRYEAPVTPIVERLSLIHISEPTSP